MTNDYSTIHNSYKNNNPDITKYEIWLVNREGDILIKGSRQKTESLKAKHLTLTAYSFHSLIKQIESKWGILCNQKNLEVIYSFKGNEGNRDYKVIGYLIEVNTKQQENLVLEKYDGKFINYSENLDFLTQHQHSKSLDLLESYTSLISNLYDKYGLEVEEIMKKLGEHKDIKKI